MEEKIEECEGVWAEGGVQYDLVAAVFHVADSRTNGNVVAVIKVRGEEGVKGVIE